MARRATVRRAKPPKPKGEALTRRGFVPFQAPAQPPPGTYDPALDAQERAAGRGYGDLLQDLEREGGYAYTDTFDPEIGSLAGLARQRDRGMADIGTARGRGEEDYGRSVEELQRAYQRLGGQQRQGFAAAGVRGGGLAQALRKRTENEAFDRVPLDRGVSRLRSDLTRDETRLGEDYRTGVSRVTTDYGRGVEQRGIAGYRAGRELDEFRLDTNQQRFFAATQGGYEPPTAPKNEHTKAGVTYQVEGQGAGRSYTTSSGRQLNRKQFVGLIRRRRTNASPLKGSPLYG